MKQTTEPMTIQEFKMWFKGLTSGMSPGVGLNSLQLSALKDAVNSLVNDDAPIKTTEEEPSGGNTGLIRDTHPEAPTRTEVDAFREAIREALEKDRIKKEEITRPRPSFFEWPKYPHDPFGPQLYNQPIGLGATVEEAMANLEINRAFNPNGH